MTIDENGNTALIRAVIDRNVDLIRIHINDDPEAINNEGYSALMIATAENYLEEMEALLEGGVDTETVEERGYTALHIAVEQNLPEAILKLLKYRANINAVNDFGNTPLMDAAWNNHVAALKALIETQLDEDPLDSDNKIDIEAEDMEGYTAVVIAAKNNCPDVLRALLDNDANIDHRIHDGGLTALIIALQEGHYDIAEMLLNYGASVEASDDELTPLMCATYRGYTDIMEMIISIDDNLDIVSNGGETALLAAGKRQKAEGVEMLIANGADIRGYTYRRTLQNENSKKTDSTISIENLLRTGKIIDNIFAERTLTEEDEIFITGPDYSEITAAQRFVFLCLKNAQGDIEKAKELLENNFKSWLRITRMDTCNLSKVLSNLSKNIHLCMNPERKEALKSLLKLSKSLYEAESISINRKHRNDNYLAPVKKYKQADEEEGNLSNEESSRNEKSSESSTSDSNNKQTTPHLGTSLSMNGEKEKETRIIITIKTEDNAVPEALLDEILPSWTYMLKLVQENIINSIPLQALLQHLKEKEAMISGPKSIAESFTELFLSNSTNTKTLPLESDRNEKITIQFSEEVIDKSIIFNGVKIAICILPMLEYPSLFGDLPNFLPYAIEL